MEIIKKDSFKFFENIRTINILSQAGFTLLVNTVQLYFEPFGEKHLYTIHTDATFDEINECLIMNSSGQIINRNNNLCEVTEKYKGKEYVFVFNRFSNSEIKDNKLTTCTNYLSSQLFNIERIGYEPSIGFIDIDGKWEIFESMELDFYSGFNYQIKEPEYAITALKYVVQYSCLHLGKRLISYINDVKKGPFSNTSISELIHLINEKNPSRYELLENLGILEVIWPEFHNSFNFKETLPDFIYESIGDGCISVVKNMPEMTSLVVIFFCIGKTYSPKASFGDITVSIDYIDYAKKFATQYLSAYQYDQQYIDNVIELLDIIDLDIPVSFEDYRYFLLDHFTTIHKFKTYLETSVCLIKMYNGDYYESETSKLLKLADAAERLKTAWCRDLVNISDDQLIKLVGEDNKDKALYYIRDFLIEFPELNDIKNIILLLMESSIDVNKNEAAKYLIKNNNSYRIDAANNQDILYLIKERQSILETLSRYDFERINEIVIHQVEGIDNEDTIYLKEYLNFSDRLSAVNNQLLAANAFSEEEKAIIINCVHLSDAMNKEIEKQQFIESIFTDTDTEFFESLYNLSTLT